MIITAIGFFLLIAAAVIQIVFLIMRSEKGDFLSRYPLLGAAALLAATIVIRSIKINFVAITNTYESLVFFAAVIAIVLFAYQFQKKFRVVQWVTFGGTIIAIIFLAIASSPIASSELRPPIPALQSGWLVLHVTMSFIGEAFFVLSFISAIVYLTAKDEEKKKNADRITYQAIGIGYPIFTAGALIFGAIWAKFAWGRFWSWDPKETWALITWLVYTAYLHSRLIKRLRGNVSAILAIVGFAFTVFTFFGVNYLLSGLHSYA